MPPDPPPRALTLWQRPAEDRLAQDTEAAARLASAKARLAIAESRQKHAEMLQVGADLVLNQLKKYLKLAESPDFENSVGPIEPKDLLKLADYVSKNYRLDTGQATENIAHAIGPSVDFSKLSQEERDQWRALAIKGGGG